VNDIWATKCTNICKVGVRNPVGCEVRFRGDMRVTQALIRAASVKVRSKAEDPDESLRKCQNVLVDVEM